MSRSSVKSIKKSKSEISLSQLAVTSSKYEDRALVGGKNNTEKFPVRLSHKEVLEINETRKLPEGYLLKFTPKTISYEYYEGTYMKNTVVPPTYNIIKTSKSPEELKDITATDILPVGFKVMNIEEGTFITGLRETPESLKKKLSKKDFMESARRLLSYVFG